LTTLLDRHARFGSGALELSFRGKGGKPYLARVSDRRVTRIVRRCRDVPGARLFQYLNDRSERQSIGSGDVNAYLRRISDARVTAKSFRTWLASVLALQQLTQVQGAASVALRKRQLNAAIEKVAEQLGNTVAICRKSYVHPGLMEAFLSDALPAPARPARPGLSPAERELVNALERLSRRRQAA
jgi:DNA topoisomerase-1